MGIENGGIAEADYKYNLNWENVALVSYEEYSKFLESLYLIDGRSPQDWHHAFFIWLSRDPKFQKIDDYLLVDIYEKNVIENGMSHERFFEWCRESDIPAPVEAHGEITPQGTQFHVWQMEEAKRVVAVYNAWAKKHKIDTTEGSVMKFIDKDARALYVATGFSDSGLVVGG